MNTGLFSPISYTFNPHAVPPLVTAIAILFLGSIVLIREKGSRESLLYLSYTLAASSWMFCASMALFMSSEVMAYRWMKFANAGVTMIPAALYHFTVVVLQTDKKHRWRVRFAWAISAVFLVVTLSTNILFDGFYHYSWGIYVKFRWPSFLFMGYFFAMTVMTLGAYWVQYRSPDRNTTKHRRAKAFLVALGIGYLGALDFLPAIGVPYYPLSSVPMICMLILVSRTIWQYRLVDITPAFAAKEIIDTMNDGLIVLDPDRVVRLVNQATCGLLGCREQDLIGKRPVDGMPACRAFADELESIIGKGTVRNREVAYHPRGGFPRTLSLSASSMLNRGGETAATVCLLNDITERKRSEEALLLFRNLLDQSNDALFVTDPSTGRLLMVNHTACRNLGYDSSELLSLRTIDIDANFPDQRSWDAHVEKVKNRGSLIVEGMQKRNDGAPLPVEVNVTYMTLGDRDYMVALARDVSERKSAEQALRTSEERLSKAQGMAHVGNWEWDLATNQLWWSEEVYRIYGVDPANFVPTFDAVGKAMYPDDLEPFLQAVNAAIYERKRFEMDYRLVRPDGGLRTVHTIGEMTYDTDGEALTQSGTVQDVTDRRRAEEERERLIAQLQEANEKLKSIDAMKTNFISMVSHELRTPLTTIKAFVELLLMKQGMPQEKKMKLMGSINVETDRLARLVTDLLDLARIEAGSMRWQVDEVSIEEVIRNVIASMGLLFENKGLRVTAAFNPPLSRFSGDHDRFVQVVTNMLSNAIKFTPSGGAIHVAARQEAAPEEQLVVEISDSGVGIPAEDLELIFEKFHRSDDKVIASIEGTGLGLAITRQIVEHHGGRIWAESTHGKGSVFTFTVPIQRPDGGQGAG
jgi:PAS domain S-box-containing protein